MGAFLSAFAIGAVVTILIMVAIAFGAFHAGVLSARKERARYTLGEALRAYTLAMMALLGIIVVVAGALELMFAP